MICPVCNKEETRDLGSFTTLSISGLPVTGGAVVTVPDNKITVTTYECCNCKTLWKNKRQYGQIISQEIVSEGTLPEVEEEPEKEEVIPQPEESSVVPEPVEVEEPAEVQSTEEELTPAEEIEAMEAVEVPVEVVEEESAEEVAMEVAPEITQVETAFVLNAVEPEEAEEAPVEVQPNPSITSFTGEYAFLSNFTECRVEFEGMVFRNSESAFQSAKIVGDPAVRRLFTTITGAQAKSLGKQLQLRPDWEEIKDDVMYRVLLSKFSAENMKAKLLATNDFQIIEENTWGDTYWGTCNGVGENKLGRLLMQVRSELGR